MRLPLGTLIDPSPDRVDLFPGECVPTTRHPRPGVLLGNPMEEQALLGIPGNDHRSAVPSAVSDRAIGHVQTKSRLPRGGIGTVAIETPVGQDRPDVAIEDNRLVVLRERHA